MTQPRIQGRRLSPYTRYKKTPHKYSAEFGHWRAAMLARHEKQMDQAAEKHSAMIHRWNGTPEQQPRRWRH